MAIKVNVSIHTIQAITNFSIDSWPSEAQRANRLIETKKDIIIIVSLNVEKNL